jgi:hypothetical protein
VTEFSPDDASMLKKRYNKLVRKFYCNKGEDAGNNNNTSLDITGEINKKLIASIFGFFFLVNILGGGGHLDWWDGTEAFLVTESMVLKHSAKLNPDTPTLEKLPFDIAYSVYSNKVIQTGNNSLDKETIPLEPVYTVRSLLLSAIGVPFYYLALVFSISPITIVGLFVNSMLIAFTSVVIFCFSYEIYRSRGISFALSLIFGVCSFVWPYHTSFWPQPLQGLTLISGTYFLYKCIQYSNLSGLKHQIRRSIINNNNGPRRASFFVILGGLFLGLSIFAHPTSIILMPGFIVYVIFSLRQEREKLFAFFLIALYLTSFFVGIINFLRFGSFTEFGYGYFGTLETHNGWAGLIGLLFSPGAGLIFFFPISILLIVAAKYMYSKNRGLLLLCSYVIIATWLEFGTLSFGFEPFAWSGAIAWGPRYLVPILPFITIVLGQLLLHITEMKDRKKKVILKTSVIGLATLGFYINLVGTLVWYQYGIMYGWDKEQLYKFTNNMDIMTWNPYYSPIVLHSKALASDFVSTIDPKIFLNSSWYWTSYGLAPCSYDIYIFCKFGLVALIGVSIPTIMIAIYILRQIRNKESTNILH